MLGKAGLVNRFFFNPVRELTQSINRDNFQADLVAALTVMVVALPQAMAYALIAKVNPVYGVYGAIVMAIVGSLLGSSNHLITGPTNAICIIVAGVMYATNGANPLGILFLLTFMVGLWQFLMGVLQLGSVVNFIPHSLIVGFTAGAGVLIAMQQFNTFLGISVPSNINLPTLQKVWYTLNHLHSTNLYSLGLALITMAMIIVSRMAAAKMPGLSRFLPGPLLGVAVATALVMLLHLDELGVKITGSVPSAWPSFNLVHFSWDNVKELFNSSLIIAILGLVEAVAIAKSMASLTGQRLDINREIAAQGMANMSGAYFSCFPGAGSFTRTAVNYSAGAKTRLAGVLSGFLVLLLLILFKPFIKYLPNASLAGVLMVVAYSMIDKKAFKEILTINRNDATVMLVTAILTIVSFQLEYAIYVGVLLSIILFLRESSKATVKVIIPHQTLSGKVTEYEVQACDDEKCQMQPVAIIQPEGNLFFGSSQDLELKLRELPGGYAQAYVLRLCNVTNIDATALEILKKCVANCLESGKVVLLSGVRPEIYDILKKTQLVKMLGQDNIYVMAGDIFSSTRSALERANQLLEDKEQQQLYIKRYL